ncbi:MAG: hypothetical protein IJY36_05430 [Coprobacter sp.]|nr:hypothetical protein [Coprobacter sp.]
MKDIWNTALKLEELCSEKDINCAIFFAEQPHTLSGGSTLSGEEVAVLFEIFARKLPLNDVKFLREAMDMVIKEREELAFLN